ncbi:MAG: orotidine-5'-phosphate decarboxylase [Gammaproteobacteria bacterium]|nr:orotidine-5'-phosphate decarboxylase [Gammaproteobacteria bacterium]
MDSPLIIALDLEPNEALKFVKKIDPSDCQLKIGNQLFTSQGPDIVKKFQDKGFKVFLDLKYHDIPNTVYLAVSSALDLDVWMLNVHTAGGEEMLRSATQAKLESNKETILLGVTVLTSLDDNSLSNIGFGLPSAELAIKLAKLAKKNSLDGVVCSAEEVKNIKEKCGKDFIAVTPGIRYKGDSQDQRRVNTAKSAIEQGSDYLVIGRPVTKSPDPVKSIFKILEEIKS